jgi:hypothetical protein
VFAGSSGHGGAAPVPAATRKTVDVVTLPAGATSVQAPILFTKFPDGVADQVMTALTRYVDDGIVNPLRKGRATTAGVADFADAGVAAQLAGPDRSVLFDERLPPAIGKLTVTTPAIPITALVGADGTAAIAIATVQLDETARTARGPVRITRRGDLEFAPDATGAWKLTGYDLTVERSGRGVPADAAHASGSTTTEDAGR